MMVSRYVRILVIFGMVAVMCGAVSAAAVGVVAETQGMSVGEYPVCTAPCECITENTAAMRWGAEGYEKCSKTICGQDVDGTVQYYCIHQVRSAVSASKSATTVTVATATTAPAVSAEATAAVQQAPANMPVTSVVIPATPTSTWPAAGSVPQKTPVGIATILTAIGALLVTAGVRRE